MQPRLKMHDHRIDYVIMEKRGKYDEELTTKSAPVR